jgi:lipopolysaccharide cholinephosphotransferase
MDKQLIRESLPDTYGFLELQNKILEIMVYVDKLCHDHDIDYCLMGGSALGAKRHGGFIPWDDDLDIFMTVDNYEKFRDTFNQYGDKEAFYLQEWGLTEGMVTIAKIRMNSTTYIEELIQDWDIHHGIYVDIFILHTCPNNIFLQLYQCFWAKYIIMRGLSLRGYSRKKGFVGFALKCMKLLPKKFLIKYGLKEIYRYRNMRSNYYCNFLGKAVFKSGIYKREWFDNLEYIPFETTKLKAPGKLHDFLSERFGDYTKIPSTSRITWEQHAYSWDTKKSWSPGKITKFKDEEDLL